MTNLLRKIPVYLTAFSALLLPNSFAQNEKADSELVTIAEREVNGKTIEYKASQDIAEHMQFLAAYASSMILGYEPIKLYMDSKIFPKEIKKSLIRELESISTGDSEHSKCEVSRIMDDSVYLFSHEGKRHYTTKGIEEHLLVKMGEKIQGGEISEMIMPSETPILGFKDRLSNFAMKADVDKDGKIAAREYKSLRDKVLKKVTYSEFSSAIQSSGKRIPELWRRVVERNWDFVEGSYFVKFASEVYRSPAKFMEENFSNEDKEEIKKVKIDMEMEEEQRGAIEMFLPWINLDKPTLADKVFLYTLQKSDGMRGGILTIEQEVEKRVIREGPVVPQRETVK